MTGKTPELSWKPLSVNEALGLVRKISSPQREVLVKLLVEEKIRAWLDDEGELRFQYKPEYLRHGGK